MLIDLHCHSLPRSTCSALGPEEAVDLARERGLDAICFTEHDRWWPESERQALAKRTAFTILTAVELTTDRGHILAFGLPDAGMALPTLAIAHAEARKHGALLFLAHPARDGLLRIDREIVDACSSVEAINGSDSRLQNLAATGLAKGFRLPGIGGSDAHIAAEVGRAATRFTRAVTDNASLLAALAVGAYEAVALE